MFPCQVERYVRPCLVVYPAIHHLSYMVKARAAEYDMASLNSRLHHDGTISGDSLPLGVESAVAWLEALLKHSRGSMEVGTRGFPPPSMPGHYITVIC